MCNLYITLSISTLLVTPKPRPLRNCKNKQGLFKSKTTLPNPFVGLRPT